MNNDDMRDDNDLWDEIESKLDIEDGNVPPAVKDDDNYTGNDLGINYLY